MSESGYYQKGDQRAHLVSQLFSSIAQRYDLINDLQSFFLHRYWKHRAVHSLKPVSGMDALDICCGTGDVAELLASRGLRVTGLDFNPQMLEIARTRSSQPDRNGDQGTSGSLKYVLGDALDLPFPDHSFDFITMSYGLRNLADFSKGLSEIARVARKGARIAILDFGKPSDPLLRNLYFQYLKLTVPLLGQIMAGNRSAYAYILESLQNYPDPEFFTHQLENLGYRASHTSFLAGIMTLITATER